MTSNFFVNVRDRLPIPGQRVFIPNYARPVIFHGVQYAPGVSGWCRGIFARKQDKDGALDDSVCSSLWSENPVLKLAIGGDDVA